MNKFIILFSLLTNTIALAATTGSITLTGVVPANTSVSIAPQGSYNNLDLSTTQTNLLVANVTEKNNTTLGYKVTVSSTNVGALKNGTLGSITYTAKYNSVSFVLSSTAVQVTTQGPQVTPVNIVKPLTISYTGIDLTTIMQGSYTDTLTFNIIAN